jgi:hypothetical protein
MNEIITLHPILLASVEGSSSSYFKDTFRVLNRELQETFDAGGDNVIDSPDKPGAKLVRMNPAKFMSCMIPLISGDTGSMRYAPRPGHEDEEGPRWLDPTTSLDRPHVPAGTVQIPIWTKAMLAAEGFATPEIHEKLQAHDLRGGGDWEATGIFASPMEGVFPMPMPFMTMCHNQFGSDGGTSLLPDNYGALEYDEQVKVLEHILDRFRISFQEFNSFGRVSGK